jgi:hypothetical protein
MIQVLDLAFVIQDINGEQCQGELVFLDAYLLVVKILLFPQPLQEKTQLAQMALIMTNKQIAVYATQPLPQHALKARNITKTLPQDKKVAHALLAAQEPLLTALQVHVKLLSN